MGWISNTNLPHFTASELMADKFSNFFMKKATIVRNKIIPNSSNNTCYISVVANIMFNRKMVEIFWPTSEIEVRKTIYQAPKQFMWLVSIAHHAFENMCGLTSANMIKATINSSMAEWVMSWCSKWAIIASLLKMYGLYKEDMTNYRYVSNLPWIAKPINKVESSSIKDHLEYVLLFSMTFINLFIVDVIQDKMFPWTCTVALLKFLTKDRWLN